MAKIIDTYFPSDWALEIGESNGLLEKVGPNCDQEKHRIRNRKMADFQKIAISSSGFENAIKLCWFKVELEKEQKEDLKFIYDSTAAWLQGDIINILTTQLQDNAMKSKEIAAISETLQEIILVEKNNNPSKPKKGLMIVKAFIKKI